MDGTPLPLTAITAIAAGVAAGSTSIATLPDTATLPSTATLPALVHRSRARFLLDNTPAVSCPPPALQPLLLGTPTPTPTIDAVTAKSKTSPSPAAKKTPLPAPKPSPSPSPKASSPVAPTYPPPPLLKLPLGTPPLRDT